MPSFVIISKVILAAASARSAQGRNRLSHAVGKLPDELVARLHVKADSRQSWGRRRCRRRDSPAL